MRFVEVTDAEGTRHMIAEHLIARVATGGLVGSGVEIWIVFGGVVHLSDDEATRF
jgi:hypothetical protein